LPDLIKVLIGRLKVTDLDGLSVVISGVVSNKFTSIGELTVELKEKCPGIVEFLLWLLGGFKVFYNDFDDALDQPTKDSIKLVGNNGI
jgi:hypothetical protein